MDGSDPRRMAGEHALRRTIRNIRDNKFVLALLVSGLRLARSLGLLRSRRIYSHVPYRGIVSVDCGGGRAFRIESKGHNIENGLYWEGLYGHEPTTMHLWIQAARNAGVVLDIGANSGVFALSAAAAGAKSIHAFEPVPRVNAILRRNFALNPGRNLNAWPHAVGEQDGTATLYDPGGDAPTSASLSAEFAHDHFDNLAGQDVEVVSTDAFCRRQGIDRVDLVKIDVEGFEEAALKGMREIIARSEPLIFIEVLEGREKVLRDLVESSWPGVYEWHGIDEGAGHVSRNVLLRPAPMRAATDP